MRQSGVLKGWGTILVTETSWHAQVLRAVLFPQKTLPLSLDFYRGLVGADPERQEDRPKEGIRRQIGPVQDGSQLQVTVAPIRIEIVKASVQKAEEFLGGAPRLTMGPFQDVLAGFSEILLRWLPTTGEIPIVRLALIGTALADAGSYEHAYEILRQNLRNVNVDPAMHDLIYRVNWRAKTELVPEGYLNRITTWSAVNIRIDAGTVPGNEIRLVDRHFAQLELDINTPAERADPLPIGDRAPIFAQIVELASRNVQAGEVP